MFTCVGRRCIIISCHLNETIKIIHSVKGLMHVIIGYFTRVLFVACTDFKNLSSVSIFMNQYLVSFISNAKTENSLNSVFHKYKKIFAALLRTQVLK